MFLGWRNCSSTEANVLLSEPWNVMIANSTGTMCSVTPNTCGNITPAATQIGAMMGMWEPIALPNLVHLSTPLAFLVKIPLSVGYYRQGYYLRQGKDKKWNTSLTFTA